LKKKKDTFPEKERKHSSNRDPEKTEPREKKKKKPLLSGKKEKRGEHLTNWAKKRLPVKKKKKKGWFHRKKGKESLSEVGTRQGKNTVVDTHTGGTRELSPKNPPYEKGKEKSICGAVG